MVNSLVEETTTLLFRCFHEHVSRETDKKGIKTLPFIDLPSVMAGIVFQEQPNLLPVINFDKMATSKKPEPKRHGDLLPTSVRAIVCGPSNCGKTNAVLALLTHPNGLRFANLYIYS